MTEQRTKAAAEPPLDCRVGHRPAGPEDQAIYQAIANNFWLARPNCLTCANRGEIDGLSQETHCSHCIYEQKWRTSHYVPNAEVSSAHD